MKLSISSKKISSSILISMTDVIFLLLLFLLIASSFTAQTGLPVKLPGSVSKEKQTQTALHIVYYNDKSISYKDKTYNIDSLGSVLKKEFKSKEQTVRLSAEKTTELQDLIDVMDIIRTAGYEKIFVATEPKPVKP